MNDKEIVAQAALEYVKDNTIIEVVRTGAMGIPRGSASLTI